MRIGLISDTHDQLNRTIRAVSLLIAEGAERLLHCGDLTSPEIVHACADLPCHYVLGNNDYDRLALEHAITDSGGFCLGYGGTFELAGKRIAATHGDRPAEFRKLLLAQPDYLCYGHSHLALNERDGATRQINPGALHRAPRWTVALLDLELDNVRFLELQ